MLIASAAAPQGLPKAATAAPKKQIPDRRAAAPAPRPQTPPLAVNQALAVPQPEVLLLMLRSAIVALHHANMTNNYAVLRELGGPGLQRFSASQLSDAFADLRSPSLNLSPVIVVTPQVVEVPTITPEGLLRLVGYFPTQPLQIHFETVFEPVNGEWKLFGLTVGAAPPKAQMTAPRQPTPSLSSKAPASAAAVHAPAEVPKAKQR
jgi:hypothetical protein